MTEQLISFETAKLAKEKGFGLNSYTGFVFDEDKTELNLAFYDMENKYARPTQSLLQKWLRDKHYILVESTHYTAKYFTFKIYERNSIINIIKLGSVDNLYDTYEEALEKGLQEALKLI